MADLDTEERNDLPDAAFAFTAQRKLPLIDAEHARNAVARFNQVEGVSDAERDEAWERVLTAAREFGVDVSEQRWQDLGGH